MNLSNFEMTDTKGKNALDLEYFAEVDVKTGALWWEKTVRRKIRRTYAGSWHFIDTGEFLPHLKAEELQRAYEAKKSLYEIRRG